MKLLRFFCYSLITLALSNNNSYANGSYEPDFKLMPSKALIKNSSSNVNKIIQKNYKVQANSWSVFDSVANYLTIGDYDLTPFFYEPITNTTLFLKRGVMDPAKDAEWTEFNSKNNLFLSVSKDRGISWDKTQNIYIGEDNSFPQARYPNMFAFPSWNSPNAYLNLFFNTTLIIENDPSFVWKGFATGFQDSSSPTKSSYFLPLENFIVANGKMIKQINGKDYKFGNYSFDPAKGIETWNSGTGAIIGYKIKDER